MSLSHAAVCVCAHLCYVLFLSPEGEGAALVCVCVCVGLHAGVRAGAAVCASS